MALGFPLFGPPAYYTYVGISDGPGPWPDPAFDRNMVMQPASLAAVRPTLHLNPASATAYTVLDYDGTVVSTGAVTGAQELMATPSGGWKYGYYTVRLTGPNTDLRFGPSYGEGNFAILPPTPGYPANTAAYQGVGGEAPDVVMNGMLGVGTARLTIGNGAAPTVDSNGNTLANAVTNANLQSVYYRPDAARPRPMSSNFVINGADMLSVAGPGPTLFVHVYCATGALDGSQVFVASGAGTTGGTSKLRVFFPNSTTLVETWDNLTSSADAQTKINGISVYISVQSYGAATANTTSATAIGNASRNGVAQAVSTLYPLGVTRFEGPSNEPNLQAGNGVEIALQMRVFQGAVKYGNAAALAIGPCPDTNDPGLWKGFLDGGGGAWCDEFSFHPYNAVANGDINCGRSVIEPLRALFASYGYGTKPYWSTEPTGTFISVSPTGNPGTAGIRHPRRSRIPLITHLFFEQYGMPAEYNQVWYGKAHGFWGFAQFLELGDGGLVPYAPLYRTLHAERFGKTHHHRIDFGTAHANHVFLGSVYRATDGTGVAVVVSHSYIDSAQVVFKVTGTTASLTWVNSWGTTASLTVAGGQVTLPVTDTPSYLRLPAGVTVTVADVNDGWGTAPSVSPLAKGVLSGNPCPQLCDNAFMSGWEGGGPAQGGAGPTGVAQSRVFLTGANTDTADLLWNGNVTASRVIVVSASPFQGTSTLADFDVQTSADGGSTWTTRATVTETDVTSVQFGTADANAGCYAETYWKERWIFDVNLGSALTFNGLRIKVRQTSYGGEPDSFAITNGGQGVTSQYISLAEIIVPSTSTPPAWFADAQTVTLAQAGLVGYWRCNEPSGPTIASLVNAPALNTAMPTSNYQRGIPLLGNSTGMRNNDGSTAVPIVSPNAVFAAGDTMTVGVTFQGFNGNGTSNLLAQQNSNNFSQISWIIRIINGIIRFEAGPVVASSSVVPSPSGPNRLVITKSGATTKIWLNAVDVTVPGTNATLATVTWGLSFLDTNILQDVVYASSAWNAAQVAADYQALFTPVVPTLENSIYFGTPLATPTIEGAAAVGQQLSVTTGRWLGNPTSYSYQWQRSANGTTGWTGIGGATRPEHLIDSADRGFFLSCLVTASNTAGAAAAQRSSVTSQVAGTASLTFYIDQEDGISYFVLEEGDGNLLLEETDAPAPPSAVGELVGVVPIY